MKMTMENSGSKGLNWCHSVLHLILGGVGFSLISLWILSQYRWHFAHHIFYSAHQNIHRGEITYKLASITCNKTCKNCVTCQLRKYTDNSMTFSRMLGEDDNMIWEKITQKKWIATEKIGKRLLPNYSYIVLGSRATRLSPWCHII